MQTQAQDTVKAFLHALETHALDEIKPHLSGDFLLQGGTPQPLNKYQFLALLVAIQQEVPEIALHIQTLREDNQFAQSDRVDVDVQVIGTSRQGKGVNAPSRLSFTLMGESIESISIADTEEEGLAHLFMQVQSVAKDEAETERLKQEEHANEDAYTRENRQRNLYDPQGKSYTPSRQDSDYAPQVDAYSIHQQHPSEVSLFPNQHEQSKQTNRQPNRHMEEQE